MIGKLAALFGYASVATLLTLLILCGYAFGTGLINKAKLSEIAAVLSGIEPETAKPQKTAKTEETSEQPSLDDIEQMRAVKTRAIEMRELSITNGVNRIAFEVSQLQREREAYDALRKQFSRELDRLLGSVKDTGSENVRLIWETIKPKQAKEQILQMIEANEEQEVVKILSAMPIAKRAKIVGEFKTEEETKKLQRLIEMIRQGVPDAKLIEDTRNEVGKFNNDSTPNP